MARMCVPAGVLLASLMFMVASAATAHAAEVADLPDPSGDPIAGWFESEMTGEWGNERIDEFGVREQGSMTCTFHAYSRIHTYGEQEVFFELEALEGSAHYLNQGWEDCYRVIYDRGPPSTTCTEHYRFEWNYVGSNLGSGPAFGIRFRPGVEVRDAGYEDESRFAQNWVFGGSRNQGTGSASDYDQLATLVFQDAEPGCIDPVIIPPVPVMVYLDSAMWREVRACRLPWIDDLREEPVVSGSFTASTADWPSFQISGPQNRRTICEGYDYDADPIASYENRISGSVSSARFAWSWTNSDPKPVKNPDLPGSWQEIKKGKPFLVALGDSYQSGEGAYNYDPATDDAGVNHCHRSWASYPFVSNEMFLNDAYNVVSLACSGALASDVMSSGDGGTSFCGTGCDREGSSDASPHAVFEDPQLDALADIVDTGADVEVVTLGIGGNDAGFSKIVEGCWLGSNCVAKFDPDGDGTFPGPRNPDGSLSFEEIMDSISADTGAIVEDIHALVPEAKIILVGYPVFMHIPASGCPSGFGTNEAEWIRGLTQSANIEIEALVDDLFVANPDLDIRYVGLDDAYGDSVHCGSGTSQINGIILAKNSGCIAVQEYDVDLVCNESMHPTWVGHEWTAEVVAECIRALLECDAASEPDTREPFELTEPFDIVLPDCYLQGLICSVGVDELISMSFSPGTWIFNKAVDFFFRSDPEYLGYVYPFADGSLRVNITVPPDAEPGMHTLQAIGPDDDHVERISMRQILVSSAVSDFDKDGVIDFDDNCAIEANASQTDGDQDGVGDVCDPVHFADTGGHWAVKLIEAVYANDITKGCGVDPLLFCPNNLLTRAELTAFVLRATGEDIPLPSHQGTFPDVPSGKWYTGYVERASQLGYVTGYGDGTFRPQQQITRAEMAVVIIRALGESDPAVPTLDPFTDVPKGSWYGRFVSRLKALGITNGYTDGTYLPQNLITRAEVAAMIQRAWELTTQ